AQENPFHPRPLRRSFRNSEIDATKATSSSCLCRCRRRPALSGFKTRKAQLHQAKLSTGEALMTNVRSMLLASARSLVVAGVAAPTAALAADQLLSGAIASAAGQKLDGVTVSAKRDGTTITTSVYTDETGNYYFPPMPEGKYQVWAQA